MIKMLEMILAIPENAGQAFVGAVGAVDIMAILKLATLFIRIHKENKEVEE